jgi:RNA recognition motif-containing protein
LVKNLSKSLTARQFYLKMLEFGEIKVCKLNVDYYGQSKGYGYVYYKDAKSAEKALEQLQGKQLDGKALQVCHLIPGKTKDNFKNNIYVKNFPKNFSEDDLKKVFEGYGEIKSVVISKDTNGDSRGFGFVCFGNPGHANTAFREMREKNITYEGLEPLYINYAQRKEERLQLLMKDSYKLENLTLFAKLRDDMYLIKTSEQFETEIKTFLKLLLNADYFPREIKIRLDSRSALITMNSQNDLDLLMSKYIDYSNYYLPRIFLNYYQSKNDRSLVSQYVNELNSMINPNNMFNNFKTLSIVDPNYTPVIKIEPGQLEAAGKKTNKNYKPKKNYTNNYNYSYNYNYNYKYNNSNYQNYDNRYYTKQAYQKPKEQIVIPDDAKSDKLSVETPLYESENKDEAASQIYEVVEKKYPR